MKRLIRRLSRVPITSFWLPSTREKNVNIPCRFIDPAYLVAEFLSDPEVRDDFLEPTVPRNLHSTEIMEGRVARTSPLLSESCLKLDRIINVNGVDEAPVRIIYCGLIAHSALTSQLLIFGLLLWADLRLQHRLWCFHEGARWIACHAAAGINLRLRGQTLCVYLSLTVDS